jgi:hypothetical protein
MIGSAGTMTFAEKLKYKADMYGMRLDVDKEMQEVKDKMNKFFYRREYTIDLYKAKGSLAIGGYCDTRSTFFIPSIVAPMHYRQAFVEELYKLGFKDDNIELYDNDYERYHQYSITVRW